MSARSHGLGAKRAGDQIKIADVLADRAAKLVSEQQAGEWAAVKLNMEGRKRVFRASVKVR